MLKDVNNNKRLTAYKKAKGVQATYFSLRNTRTSHPNIVYWQVFFKGEPIPKEAPYYIHDAAAMIRLENLSEEERQMAEAISKSEAIRRAERQYDIEEGIELGIEQGKQEEQQRMIVSMYQQDLPLVQIASITGLSIGQIKEILENQS
ncbi:hypothetical protein [Dolosicoccus paucivorans]|uniref:hypothetical protein n=1 Tax=Dolosicoccus paucivorans TaxID=84521 RepID=UPI00088496F2|nr:hypothetical protein [Dolosicoccus paucivorans]SDI87582.1 conserved hypothetical protein (putative transposase or invertase) [Dolosicoccus paucivorans]